MHRQYVHVCIILANPSFEVARAVYDVCEVQC